MPNSAEDIVAWSCSRASGNDSTTTLALALSATFAVYTFSAMVMSALTLYLTSKPTAEENARIVTTYTPMAGRTQTKL
jgi:hypothetical protein